MAILEERITLDEYERVIKKSKIFSIARKKWYEDPANHTKTSNAIKLFFATADPQYIKEKYYNAERNAKCAACHIGRKHSKEWNKKISIAKIGKKDSLQTRINKSLAGIKRITKDKGYISKSAGYRQDLKQYFRFVNEANYARFLNFIGVKWEYESDKCLFRLSNGKHYLCDFYLPETNEFVELKGYLKQKSKIKYEFFKKEYLNIKWRIIFYESKDWQFIVDEYSKLIEGWE